MTRTLRQKVFRRVGRDYSQFKDVSLYVKALLLANCIETYSKPKESYVEEDYENLAMAENILHELEQQYNKIDFPIWVESLRHRPTLKDKIQEKS